MKQWDASINIGGWPGDKKIEVFDWLSDNFGSAGSRWSGFFDLHVEAILMDEDVYNWLVLRWSNNGILLQ